MFEWLFFLYIIADIILPVINSSVDSPIASAKCMSDQRHTGSGDFEFRDIFEDVSNHNLDWASENKACGHTTFLSLIAHNLCNSMLWPSNFQALLTIYLAFSCCYRMKIMLSST